MQEQQQPRANELEQEVPAPDGSPSAHQLGPSGEPIRQVSAGERRGLNRRELLKLVPVVALGAFAIPKLQDPLLRKGLALSDWASEGLFSRHRLAPEFSNSQVAPFERFPYNYYDVLDPEVDFAAWTLTVEGLVQHPGDYKLAQIQSL